MQHTKKDSSSLDELHSREGTEHLIGRKPVWEVMLGILVVGIIYAFLPAHLRFGPPWLLLVLEVILILPMFLFALFGRPLSYRVTRTMSLMILGLVTAGLAIGVVLMITTLSSEKSAGVLLRSAALLWGLNVLVFSLWFWEVDGGGARKRHEAGHKASDLMFPQQTNGASWQPRYFDYLFVAFTTATAFSPTDTFPLTHRAKVLMIIEGMLSVTIVVILLGRVVNIF